MKHTVRAFLLIITIVILTASFAACGEESFSRKSSAGIKNESRELIWKNTPTETDFRNIFKSRLSVSLSFTPLSLAYSEPQSVIYSLMNRLTWEIILLLLLGFSIGALGLTWLTLRIVKPLTRLTKNVKESEKPFRQMSENIDQGFLLTDPELSKTFYANSAFKTLLGLTIDDISEGFSSWFKYMSEEKALELVNEITSFNYEGQQDSFRKEIFVEPQEQVKKEIKLEFFPVIKDGELNRLVCLVTDVTEENQLRREIKKQREYLRTIIDAQPQLIFVKDWNGRYQLANQTLLDIYGTTEEELLGNTDATFQVDDEELKSFIRDDRQVMKSGEIKEIPEEPLTNPKTGEKIWFYTIKVPLKTDHPPEERQVLGVATDITAKRNVQKKLEAKHSRLQLAKEAGETGIWDYKTVSQELIWDKTMEEIFGRTAEKYDHFLECVHPDDKKMVEETIRKSLEMAEPWHQQYRIYRQNDNQLRWIDAHAVVKSDPEDQKTLIGSCVDITERKQNERFLRQLNQISSETETSYVEKIKNVLELGTKHFDLPLGFVTNIRKNTQEIEYVFGNHPLIKPGNQADLSKAYCSKTIQQDQPVFLNTSEKVREALGEKPFETFELSCYLGGKLLINGEKHGTVCFASEKDRPDIEFTENDNSKLQLIIQWIQSQLERKIAFENMDQARQEAEEANRSKSQFLARMSHEIRTPLNAIMGMSELLAETELNSEQKHYVDVFQNSSEILLNLINDILDLSKIEAGELQLNEDYIDLEKLVVETVEFFSQKAHEQNLDLNVYVDPQCPASVKADEARFRQVIVNLLSNALKFTEQGEVNVRLEVKAADGADSSFRVEFEDTGIGISPADQGAIFEEFKQADESASRKYSGTGLGLNITKMLVEKMGGKIGLESKLGVGSLFYFEVTFPCGDAKIEKTVLDGDVELAGISILVVDDNETNLEIIEKYLAVSEVKVTTTADPKRALKLLEEERGFDIILLDYEMPGLNGLDVLKRLPGDYQPRSVLMLSSNNLSETRRQVEEEGVGGYIVKPVSRYKLERALVELLQQNRGEKTDHAPAQTERSDVLKDEPLKGRVLLVEDNANNRLVVNSYLGKEDIEIEEAIDGIEALEKMKDKKYDLVLMDLEMPGLDGYEATRRYREWEQENRKGHQHILALTAHAMEGARKKALEHGCDDYLSKPVKKYKLMEKMKEYM